MARYYLHLVEGDDVLLDPEGVEMSESAVRRLALDSARDCIAADAREGMIDLTHRIDVHDAEDTVVHSLSFASGVTLTRPGAESAIDAAAVARARAYRFTTTFGGSTGLAPESRNGRAVRYFFNLAGAVHDPDNEGYELADLSEARIQAVRFASEYLRDRPDVVWMGEEFRVEVTDENRLVLFTFIAVGVDAPAAGGR